MHSEYLDKLIEYMTIRTRRRFNIKDIEYGSFKNLRNLKLIFSYPVYQNEEGITYSANIYYWYYLCLIVL